MIEQYGKEPSMAGALLEFLQVLAEEYATNLKLEVRNDFGRGAKGDSAGKEVARGEQADQVIQLLSMYVQASGESSRRAQVKKGADPRAVQGSRRRCRTSALPASVPGYERAKLPPSLSPEPPSSPPPSPRSLRTSSSTTQSTSSSISSTRRRSSRTTWSSSRNSSRD